MSDNFRITHVAYNAFRNTAPLAFLRGGIPRVGACRPWINRGATKLLRLHPWLLLLQLLRLLRLLQKEWLRQQRLLQLLETMLLLLLRLMRVPGQAQHPSTTSQRGAKRPKYRFQ